MKEMALIAVAALSSSPPMTGNLPDAAVMEKLRAGEVVALEPVTAGDDGAAARMQILVRAPARSFWEVVVSCDKARVFIRGLELCEILEDHGTRVLVHQVIRQSWVLPREDFVFESLRSPYRRIDIRLVRGNVRALSGRWLFTETPDGLLVDYQMRVEPGFPFPRFLIQRRIERHMPDLLACLRGLAGGSLQPGQQAGDLSRCREA